MYVNDRRESYETRQQLAIQMDVVNFTKRLVRRFNDNERSPATSAGRNRAEAV